MNYINFNGNILKSGTAIIEAGNRGLRYGDGLFETIKYKHNEFQLLHSHFDRLWKGFELLQFDIPKHFTRPFIEQEMMALVQKNQLQHARVRLTIVKGNGGLYDAVNHHPNYIIECWALDENFGQLNVNGLQAGLYTDTLKSCDAFSNLKHNNFIGYAMAALFAKKKRWNDAVLLNQHEHICDTTIANIFLIKDEVVFTPALTEGCIAGTLRQFLIKHLPNLGYTIIEKQVTKKDLLEADEIFFTNAMTPVKWVAGINDSVYSNKIILDIHYKFSQTFPRIFC